MSQFWSDAERQKHMRAICEEIGERLRSTLDGTAQEPPARLTALIRRFEQPEQIEAPSIAPTHEELAASQRKESPATGRGLGRMIGNVKSGFGLNTRG